MKLVEWVLHTMQTPALPSRSAGVLPPVTNCTAALSLAPMGADSFLLTFIKSTKSQESLYTRGDLLEACKDPRSIHLLFADLRCCCCTEPSCPQQENSLSRPCYPIINVIALKTKTTKTYHLGRDGESL